MAERRDSNADVTVSERGKAVSSVTGVLTGMAGWKKKLLAGFLVMALVGAGMMVPSLLDRSTSAPAARQADVPEGSRSLIDSGNARADSDASARSPSWNAQLGGWMARLGLSFAAGLIVGVFFRAFLKTMALITVVAVGLLAALSYFDIVDVSSLRSGVDSAAGWASERGGELKDSLLHVLPSAGTAVVGFFAGFLKK